MNDTPVLSGEVLVMDRVNVGCELRAAAVTLEPDLAVMEHLDPGWRYRAPMSPHRARR
jgi:hypothetical protein